MSTGTGGVSSTTSHVSSAESIRAATLRLMSDLKSLSSECPPGVSASPMNESDLFTWVASIAGPDESPFEGMFFFFLLF